MRCLLISPNFPPTNKVSSLRGYYFALAFRELGWEVDILCSDGEDMDLPRDCSGFSIYRYKSSRSLFSSFLSAFNLVCRRRSSRDSYHLIISTYGPSLSHVLGRISCLFWMNAKWIADYRDLWSSDGYYTSSERAGLKRVLVRAVEAMILKRADLITTVSKGVAASLSRFHRREVLIFRNGFERAADLYRDSHSFRQDGVISICYTGTLNRHRNPAEFIELVSQAVVSGSCAFKCKFAGALFDGVEVGLNRFYQDGLVIHLGGLTREQSYSLQKESDICLLLEDARSSRNGALTGKLFEYLHLGKPVIAYGVDEQSELAEIIRASGLCIYVGNDKDGLVRALTTLPNALEALEPHWEYINSFDRISIAREFSITCAGLVNEAG